MFNLSSMIADPVFYALAVPAVLMVGISKGGFAGGIGLIAVPMMALVIPPVQAAGIMLPILIAMDLMSAWAYRTKWDKTNLFILLPGAVIGIAFGTATAHFVSDDAVRLIIGSVAVLFTLHYWFRGGEARAATGPNRIKGTLWGTVGGYTSFVAHAGSPPFQVYMLPQKLDKTIYVGTSVMFFTVVNWVKLPAYAWLGQLAPGNLMTSAVLLPLAPIGVLLGIWLHNIIPEKPFYRVIYTMIFIVGLKLLWDGASGAVL